MAFPPTPQRPSLQAAAPATRAGIGQAQQDKSQPLETTSNERIRLPETGHPMQSFIEEEMAQSLLLTLARVFPILPSPTRWRLMTFVHLLEKPEAMQAELQVDASGAVRLILVARGAMCSQSE